jgi:hypothetical protein
VFWDPSPNKWFWMKSHIGIPHGMLWIMLFGTFLTKEILSPPPILSNFKRSDGGIVLVTPPPRLNPLHNFFLIHFLKIKVGGKWWWSLPTSNPLSLNMTTKKISFFSFLSFLLKSEHNFFFKLCK